MWRVGAASVQVVLTAAAPIYAFDWSPAGETLAVIDQTGKTQVVKLNGSKLFERKFAAPRLNQFQRGGLSGSLSSIPFGPDGKSIAIVERDALEIVPLDGKPAKTFKFEASNSGSWGSFFWWSSDGSRLIAFRKGGGGKSNTQLVTWNVATGERNTCSDFPDEVTSIDCSLDGKLAVLGYDTGFWQVRRLDDLKASPIESDPAVHFQTIRSVAFSQDGRRFATGGWDGLIKIWSAEGVYQQTLYGNEWPIHLLMWSPDGQKPRVGVARPHHAAGLAKNREAQAAIRNHERWIGHPAHRGRPPFRSKPGTIEPPLRRLDCATVRPNGNRQLRRFPQALRRPLSVAARQKRRDSDLDHLPSGSAFHLAAASGFFQASYSLTTRSCAVRPGAVGVLGPP